MTEKKRWVLLGALLVSLAGNVILLALWLSTPSGDPSPVPSDPKVSWTPADQERYDAELKQHRDTRELLRLGQDRKREIAARHKAGDAFFNRGFYEDAHSFYSQIVTLDPLDRLAQVRKEKCEEKLRKERERVREVEARALELERDKIHVQEEKQAARERRAKAFTFYVRAAQAVQTAKRMDPRPITGFTITDARNKLREARNALTRALRNDETYAEAYFLRGQLRHKMGDYELAMADFENASKRSSGAVGEPAAYEGTALFAAAMSDLALYAIHSHTPLAKDLEARDRALERMYQKAHLVNENTDSPALERFCGKALVQFYHRDIDAALQLLSGVGLEGKENAFYHFITASLHVSNRDYPAAKKELERTLLLEPMLPEAHFLLAVIKAKIDDLPGALLSSNAAVAAMPEAYMNLLLRAEIRYQLGQTLDGLADLQEASTKAGAPKEQIQNAILGILNEKGQKK